MRRFVEPDSLANPYCRITVFRGSEKPGSNGGFQPQRDLRQPRGG